MSRRVALVLGAGVVAAFMLVGPGTASAATTIGQTGVDGGACTNRTFVQKDLTSGPSYSPSASGVITSWGAEANSATGQTLQLAVFRRDSDMRYTILRRDSVRTLANLNALNTFTGLRLPIEAGQLIGVYQPPGSMADCELNGSLGDGVAYSPIGDPADNVPTDYEAVDTTERVNAQAVVEPDADHDGFGDETQDQCPTNAATQGPCPVTPVKKKCKHKKRKSGAVIAKKCKKKHHH
jgi:hypothetical protein